LGWGKKFTTPARIAIAKIFKLVKSQEFRLDVFQEALLEKARHRYKFWECPQNKASGFLCFWDYFYWCVWARFTLEVSFANLLSGMET
jgi:hypothetical protein